MSPDRSFELYGFEYLLVSFAGDFSLSRLVLIVRGLCR